MRYLIAILLPPLAVFLCGKPFQAILNIFLTLLFWVPGMIHAILVVHNHLEDKRANRIIKAMKERA
ncbi:MAG: YqaE/Pmp3 family membrane protein [Gammaproteobacteria bacterium]|nr:YqaE/Pmp3 family membrane protein [Gammaproteobacteria bacterium]